MSNLTMGELFSGQCGFSVAGELSGIKTKFMSEVEIAPIMVERARFPEAKQLGDVSKVNGSEIEPVDIITFGAPCTDLSVAGKRMGMKHELNGDSERTRSGLFFDAVRIIEEMREVSGKPRYGVYENVQGAYSSAKGEDFRRVLEELCQIKDINAEIPLIKWPSNGEIVGKDYSLAWRVVNAMHWGVPQRRRRIYLLADFDGHTAGKIMFRNEGLEFHARVKKWTEFGRDSEPMTGEEFVRSFNEQLYEVEEREINEPSGKFARLDMQTGLWSTEVPDGYFIGEKPYYQNPTKLSEILQPNADPKYYLSPKAAQGILRRARERGKELPEVLRIALENQAKESPNAF